MSSACGDQHCLSVALVGVDGAASCLVFLLGLFLLAPADLASVVSLTLVLRLLSYILAPLAPLRDDVGFSSLQVRSGLLFIVGWMDMSIGVDRIHHSLMGELLGFFCAVFLLAGAELPVDVHIKVALRLELYTLVPLVAAGDDDGFLPLRFVVVCEKSTKTRPHFDDFPYSASLKKSTSF